MYIFSRQNSQLEMVYVRFPSIDIISMLELLFHIRIVLRRYLVVFFSRAILYSVRSRTDSSVTICSL